MNNLIGMFLGFGLIIGVGGSAYDRIHQMAIAGKDAYQFDQLSYSRFTKSMTSGKLVKSTEKCRFVLRCN